MTARNRAIAREIWSDRVAHRDGARQTSAFPSSVFVAAALASLALTSALVVTCIGFAASPADAARRRVPAKSRSTSSAQPLAIVWRVDDPTERGPRPLVTVLANRTVAYWDPVAEQYRLASITSAAADSLSAFFRSLAAAGPTSTTPCPGSGQFQVWSTTAQRLTRFGCDPALVTLISTVTTGVLRGFRVDTIRPANFAKWAVVTEPATDLSDAERRTAPRWTGPSLRVRASGPACTIVAASPIVSALVANFAAPYRLGNSLYYVEVYPAVGDTSWCT